MVDLYIKRGHGLVAVLQSIEEISFIKTVQKVNRQTFMERARMNNGCGDESKSREDVRVSQSPKSVR